MIRVLVATGILVIPLMLSSCTTPPLRSGAPVVFPLPPAQPPADIIRRDIMHTVAPGETLFRLGRMYDVRVEDIRLRNSLRPADNLRMGQKLTIPSAAPQKEVIPLFPSGKWKYIVLHHSATDEDDALSLYAMHQRRGWDSTGYDFLIDNGTRATVEGHVTATPRWIAQKDGAHCKADQMNARGIGICLIGNFSKEDVSDVQLTSLARLVNTLTAYYRIPRSHILGHGQVRGARTECPGKHFPWKRFWKLLDQEKALQAR